MTLRSHAEDASNNTFSRWFNGTVRTDLSDYRSNLAAIHELQHSLSGLSDSGLRERLNSIRSDKPGRQKSQSTIIDVFALVNLAAERCLDLQPHDEQILAGLALHNGNIVEMQTGEGKTLAAVAPAVLNALSGDGVHILTFNDYLARRDASWMGPVFRLLGMSVGCVQDGMPPSERRQAYSADITYLMAREAGFDFLREFLCYEPQEVIGRGAAFALVDEADSILIDEARIPLVIAGHVETAPAMAFRIAELARSLTPNIDFDTDEHGHNIFLTERGSCRVEELLSCKNLFDEKNIALLTELRNALHAEHLLRRNVDYIVRNDVVELVDDFTGRVADKRQWPDGLQAAIEAKEGLELRDEGRVLGSITMQHFLRTYDRLSGMTATAIPAAEELHDFYDLEVVVIPDHRPRRRVDHPDLVFTHLEAKRRAVVDEITRTHRTGQPVLVGTSSVEESEELARQLSESGIHCRVLNARNDDAEAEIISHAGSVGAVTISTNMAGRGTDIRLGGPEGTEHETVADHGGLYVLGTNRHESLRIDHQLCGRAGRQGDPGKSRFFVSLEDPLVNRYGVQNLIAARFMPDRCDKPVESTVLQRELVRAQRIIEGENHSIRHRLWNYSHPLELQRLNLQGWRQGIVNDEIDHDLLAALCPDRHDQVSALVGSAAATAIEKRVLLLTVDTCWSDHLEQVSRIRDGIHVVGNVGKDPLAEYYREIGSAFASLRHTIETTSAGIFTQLEVSDEGADWASVGLQNPSSTWTYLVHDNPFGSNTMQTIANRTGHAFWGTILLWPVFLGWGLWRHAKRLKNRWSSRPN